MEDGWGGISVDGSASFGEACLSRAEGGDELLRGGGTPGEQVLLE